MRKITTGDDVIVVAGKDKGRRGTVRQILDDRAIVDGVNVARKHQKGNPNSGVTGGIIAKEMPIDPKTGKGGRVGFKTLDDGKKVRIFKSNGETV